MHRAWLAVLYTARVFSASEGIWGVATFPRLRDVRRFSKDIPGGASSIRLSLPLANGHLYYSSGSSGDGENGEGGEESEEGESGEKENNLIQSGLHQQYALAPVAIPDTFPEVPILPVSRNPIFPKFVKLLEVRVHL